MAINERISFFIFVVKFIKIKQHLEKTFINDTYERNSFRICTRQGNRTPLSRMKTWHPNRQMNRAFFVTPQRFELQLTGPKPVVLPLDERVIFARSPIPPSMKSKVLSNFSYETQSQALSYSLTRIGFKVRKMQDSNLRYLAVQQFSRLSRQTNSANLPTTTFISPPELPTVPTNDQELLSEQILRYATAVFRSRVLRAIVAGGGLEPPTFGL